jgi:Transposase DDE domain
MKTESRMECQKAHYKVRNWPEYNKSLTSRGSITFWIPGDCDSFWYHDGPPKRGAQWVYSDAAVETALIVKKVFNLALRQTQGFLDSVLGLLGTGLKSPDYSVICRRQAALKSVLEKFPNGGKIDLVFDSTGLKVYGEGEWKVRKHGASKRRTWRKLHVAVDPTTTEVHAVTLTENGVHDCEEVEPLLAQVTAEVGNALGDGAYDKHKAYRALEKRGIRPKIPPQHNALLSKQAKRGGEPKPRDMAIQGCAEMGRKEWKQSVGYHQRSKVETFMYRYKKTFGDQLKARKIANQATEVRIACKALNKMAAAGMPISTKVS